MADFDPVRFKEQEKAGFNMVADRYEAAMELLAPVTTHMIKLAKLKPGQKILDVATGPGILARIAARAVGTSGEVVGIDIAEAALEVARQKAAAENLSQVSFEEADAENLYFGNDRFDVVFCSMGLMHFPVPEKALEQALSVLKPGGRLIASVWGKEEDAPFIGVALTTLNKHFGKPKVERPSMFRFGHEAILRKLVADAGFADVDTHTIKVEASFDDAPSYWQRFLDAAGITAVALAKQTPEVNAKLVKDVETDLATYKHENGYKLVSSITLVSAIKRPL